MNTFNLHILAADKTFYEGECESLIVPTVNGQYGILAHHLNTISAVIPGKLTVKKPEGEKIFAAVSGGIIKIENNDVLVLVETAELPDEIDARRAEKALAKAKEDFLQKKSIKDHKTAEARMARALSRLKVKHDYGSNL